MGGDVETVVLQLGVAAPLAVHGNGAQRDVQAEKSVQQEIGFSAGKAAEGNDQHTETGAKTQRPDQQIGGHEKVTEAGKTGHQQRGTQQRTACSAKGGGRLGRIHLAGGDAAAKNQHSRGKTDTDTPKTEDGPVVRNQKPPSVRAEGIVSKTKGAGGCGAQEGGKF